MNRKTATLIRDFPKLALYQLAKSLRVACRREMPLPKTQQDLANFVDHALVHEIRAGFEHRFITLLFVTSGERVFCRRYTYGEPSWHSAFLSDSKGQIKLDKTIVNIDAIVPPDLEDITPAVDAAYEEKLKKLGASFMLSGAIEPRAHASTLELLLSE